MLEAPQAVLGERRGRGEERRRDAIGGSVNRSGSRLTPTSMKPSRVPAAARYSSAGRTGSYPARQPSRPNRAAVTRPITIRRRRGTSPTYGAANGAASTPITSPTGTNTNATIAPRPDPDSAPPPAL
ncbi:hypothetical protein ACFQY7_49975 [Actinomadura luteofluorescens]|uniref:hypothetical protein n=1 Tax=Actinomadura luteofluorescens TaxID=46163 RepID=UPI00362B3570